MFVCVSSRRRRSRVISVFWESFPPLLFSTALPILNSPSNFKDRGLLKAQGVVCHSSPNRSATVKFYLGTGSV